MRCVGGRRPMSHFVWSHRRPADEKLIGAQIVWESAKDGQGQRCIYSDNTLRVKRAGIGAVLMRSQFIFIYRRGASISRNSLARFDCLIPQTLFHYPYV